MPYSGGGGMSAVDAILAEAADLVALEQIARLNTAHLDDSAALPSSLESRFRKLKSLPVAAAAAPPPAKTLGRSVTAPPQRRDDPPADSPPQPSSPPLPAPEEAQKAGNSPPQPQAHPPPPKTTTVPAVREEDEQEEEDLERLFGPRRGRPTLKERNRPSDGDSRSPPPPRQACCFPFSPKRAPAARRSIKTHAGGDRDTDDVLGVGAGEWGDENRRVATELREQQRRLKKALEEQVKVSRETAKMARWVKQASARMTHTDAIDDLLSDLDDDDEQLK